MIQMRRKFMIPMTPGCDMEVPLHLIPFQTTVDPTRVLHIAPTQLRALSELLSRIRSHMVQYMARVDVLLLLQESVRVFAAQRLVFIRPVARLVVPFLHPQDPARVLLFQQAARENVVARGVLDVDAEAVAWHVDDDVEVELQLV